MRSLAAALALTACVALTSCTSDSDSDDPIGDDFSVAEVLASLPADAESSRYLTVSMGDVEAAAEANGVTEPLAVENLTKLTGSVKDTKVALISPFNGQEASGEEMAAWGTDWREHEWFAEVMSGTPIGRLTVLGDGPEPAWPDSLADLGDGVRSYGTEADGHLDPDNAAGSPDRMGRPVRVASRDDQYAWSFSTPLVTAWVQGSKASLADDKDLAAVAEVLDRHDVVSAHLMRSASTGTVGLGWVGDGTVRLVYVLDADEAAAADVVRALEQIPTADLTDVTAEPGTAENGVPVLDVSLTPPAPMVALNMLSTQSIPFPAAG